MSPPRSRQPYAIPEYERHVERMGGRENVRSPRRRRTPPSKRGQRWWSTDDGRDTYRAVIDDLNIPVSERGRIIGDRGSNVRKIVQAMCAVLRHDASKHERPPFVQFNDSNGMLEFELELYPPFNNEESFKRASHAFRQVIDELLRAQPLQSLHCKRPKRVQPDDWDCPNAACGNLNFAKRRSCNVCGTPKPAGQILVAPSVSSNEADIYDPNVSRRPKHRMEMVSTLERLGEPLPGEAQIVYLVPSEDRGWLLGKGGANHREIQADTGCVITLTHLVEGREVQGELHILCIVRGMPGSVYEAVRRIRDSVKGRGCFGQDGFENFLAACERLLRRKGGCRVEDFRLDPEVREAYLAIEDLAYAAGCGDSWEVVERFPNRFRVQHSNHVSWIDMHPE